MFEWDEAKRRTNIAKHGVDLTEIARFDWLSASVKADARRKYGEKRLSATGLIDRRLHVCVFTPRGGNLRLISLRKANRRDIAKWHAERN